MSENCKERDNITSGTGTTRRPASLAFGSDGRIQVNHKWDSPLHILGKRHGLEKHPGRTTMPQRFSGLVLLWAGSAFKTLWEAFGSLFFLTAEINDSHGLVSYILFFSDAKRGTCLFRMDITVLLGCTYRNESSY